MSELAAQVDPTLIQKAVDEYALKGAIETIKEFYTGYNSPYRKAIEKSLSTKDVNATFISLPDIIANINDALSKEIDIIANAAISKSFVPLLHKFLTREEKELKFSEVLEKFIAENDVESIDDVSLNIETDAKHGWLSINLTFKDEEWEATLHEEYDSKKEKDAVKKYHFLSLPRRNDGGRNYPRTMKLTVDGGTLEMPFTPDVLRDKFSSIVARLIIAGTKITMDTREFSEDMFPQNECHCD